MKIFIGIVIFCSLWCSNAFAVSLPKDVASGSKFKKSLTGSYYKKYGMQVVDKEDGHPVRAGKKSIRFEVRAGDCGKDKDGGWSDCDKDRERHELSGKYRVSKGERWYAWSIYLPSDFINVHPTSTMLAQFHQERKHVIWMFKNKRGGYWLENYVPEYTVENIKIKKKLTSILSENINSKMVLNGQAVAYRRYSKEYINDEETAKNNNVGIWQGEFDMPWEWRKKNK